MADDYGIPTTDQSHLGKPINIGFSGIQHVIRCIQNGTSEVRDLLLNECELLYECRSCRSIFRSLANFLLHKRDYCKNHFCEKMVLFSAEDSPEDVVIVQPESPGPSNLNDNWRDSSAVENDGEIDSDEGLSLKVLPAKISNPLDIKAATKGASNPAVKFYKNCEKKAQQKMSNEIPNLRLKTISTNSNAVFQSSNKSRTSSTKTERVDYFVPSTSEPPASVAKDVIEAEAEETASEAGVKRSRLESRSTNFKCTKCESQFRTMRTLEFHMRITHTMRLPRHPCPKCTATFTQYYSVNRHLMTVHKVRSDEANKLHNVVHNKVRAHVKNSAVFAKRQNIDEVDGAENLVCSNCARHFRKRSSWIIHEKFCIYKLQNRNKSEPKQMDLQDASTSSRQSTNDKAPFQSKVSKPNIEISLDVVPNESNISSVSSGRPKRNAKKKPEADFVDISNKTYSRLPNRTDSTKKPPEAFEKEVLAIVNIKKIQCLKCHRHFSSFANLRRHAAIHIGWNRFKCKYCGYQSYNRSDCRSHVRRIHLQKKTNSASVDKYVLDLPLKGDSTVTTESNVDENPEIMQCKVSIPQLSVSAVLLPKIVQTLSPGLADKPEIQKEKVTHTEFKTPKHKITSMDIWKYGPKEKTMSLEVKNIKAKVTKPSPAITNPESKTSKEKATNAEIKNSKEKSVNAELKNSNAATSSRQKTPSTVKVLTNGVNHCNGVATSTVSRGTTNQPEAIDSDSMLTLVTRSGSYSKAKFLRKYFEDRNIDMDEYNADSESSALVDPTYKE